MEPENVKRMKRELKRGTAVLIELDGDIRQALVEEVSPNGEFFRVVTKGDNARPLWMGVEKVLDVLGVVDIDAALKKEETKEVSKLRVDGRHVF